MDLLQLAAQAGLSPIKVSSTHGGEYKSGCPRCGGSKRFFIQPHRVGRRINGMYCCRECGIKGDTISFAIDILNKTYADVKNIYALPERESHLLKPRTLLS